MLATSSYIVFYTTKDRSCHMRERERERDRQTDRQRKTEKRSKLGERPKLKTHFVLVGNLNKVVKDALSLSLHLSLSFMVGLKISTCVTSFRLLL